ncbi:MULTISPECIES: sorbosone dehydrogenase family protein [unclassified Fusibacter]|uniref:PQQ-dependent sugar dehydrogenase n=1 Tax=unclassified Fusibacter TaxID=2624464 RepID=UPI0013E8FC9D|nr:MULTISPECIES: PQQ-dependent sugar dehydrogenase [unclassified Fusibacter]MCK8058135.1 PQQ-dependent sugar dehydrogenase [Fusibacter sp. A2]NPE20717.1 glucose sorbosone dehydrogenase [Fusibacter sp. A1]
MNFKYINIIALLLVLALIAACSPESDQNNGFESQSTSEEVFTETTTSTVTTTVTTTATTSNGGEPERTELEELYQRYSAPGEYTYERVFESIMFTLPLHMTYLKSEPEFVYVVQKNGHVLKVDTKNDRSTLFLDVSDKIDVSKSEKGLLGFAFHPNYPDTPYVYISYTNQSSSIIASLEANDGEINKGSHKVLLSFDQPFGNHNGGHLEFGPDGYLFIASGDGGSAGDPQNNGQNLGNLLGKILRIDVDSKEEGLEYGLPDDNPFINHDARGEIFAYGLRNPWKFSFDKTRGIILAADVGQGAIEEIDIIYTGRNYGWPIKEGTQVYKNLKSDDELIDPIWEYMHPIGKSITGGFTYYGTMWQDLYGYYIYGDFVSGQIWALWIDERGVVKNHDLFDTSISIASFGQDASGQIYILDIQGKIYRFTE